MSHTPKSKELNIGDIFQIGSDNYEVLKFLPGRGPGKGLGVFAKKLPDGPEFIVKDDKPSICVAEGLMTLSNIQDASKAAIQASLGILKKGENSPPTLVTIQPKFVAEEGQMVQGFDEFILKRKRDPKTFWSEESKNQEAIATCISTMTEPVKKQLAKAIFLSQLNGDESLHIGQFMVSFGQDREITGIVKVDFGALGRWAGKRLNEKDFDIFTTSQAYTKTISQLGNDYVSYLLQDDTIRKELVRLWATLDKEQFKQDVEKKFDELSKVLDSVDRDSRGKILRDFYNDVLFKGCDKPSLDISDPQTISSVKKAFLETTEARFEQTFKHAQSIRTIRIKEFIKELPEFPQYITNKIAKISTLEELKNYITSIQELNLDRQNPNYKNLMTSLCSLKEELEPTQAKTTTQFKNLLKKLTQIEPPTDPKIRGP